MYSELIPWEEFVTSVSDDTGIENLSNKYPTLRRSVYRTARDIGFGGTILLKQKTFTVIEDAGNRRFKLPEDIVRIEDVGMCEIGFCPDTYRIQGNYLFVCDPRITEFKLFYYAMLIDENGNPYITGNHYEAMIAGAVRTLYKPNRFMSKGNANTYAQMENEYDQRVGEARGSDVMPTTHEEWLEIASMLSMSRKDYLIYSIKDKKYCCATDEETDTGTDPGTTPGEVPTVFYWQSDNFAFDTNSALALTQEDLSDKPNSLINVFNNGTTLPFDSIGKIVIAIQKSLSNEYSIFDFFNQNITNVVFEKAYNSELEVDFFVSKNIYSIGDVYFKTVKN